MNSPNTDTVMEIEELQREIEELRARLVESEETLRAIHEGEVDALVVKGPKGDCIYTLQGAEHSYRVLVEQMQEGAVTLLPDGTVRYCNRRFAEMLQRPMEKVFGASITPYIHEPDGPAFHSLVRHALTGRAQGDVDLCASNGALIPVHLGLSRVMDGEDACLCIVVTDLTERKRAEAVLASEQFTRRLIENAPIGIAVVGRDLRYILANPAYQAITGDAAASMAGRSIAEVWPAEVARMVRTLVEQGLRSGQPVEFREHEIPIRGRSWWNINQIPLRSHAGKLEAVLILTQEVTEQKLAEEALIAAKLSAEHAKAAAEHASSAKDHFLAVLSHELRTPLSAVIPALQMLAAKVSGEDAENLEIARRNVELEARLIDDLLDVTRIARGKIELDRRPIELCTIIRHAAEVCMPDIEARGLHFGIEVEDNPPHWIDGDPARIQQVFWNLIKNAVKFTPSGGCVGVRVRAVDGQGVVEVTDSGHGIEPEHLSVLFNAFEQAERSITRQFGGLGLGLAISKALVDLHGGTIAARSDGRGKGATFTVQLPLTVGAGHAPPLRILLVEDHGDTARMMRRLLRSEGHEVQHASDVATALALATAEPFDVMLSDLGLPDGSGHDLLRGLREKGVKLKAIALSGYGMAADVEQSLKAGFIEHMTKPVNFDALQQALRRLALRGDGS